ncbi:MAG: TraB/GumN family protein [Prevotellaceae bacterium]|nr:TraB/GumN family protein [Prevotellaceae bacterium]
MKNRFCAFLLLLTATLALPAQLLWKISGPGLAAPSYLLGTMHTAPDTFALHIDGLQEALQTCEAVCGEMDMREASTSEGRGKQQEALFLPDGTTLPDLLDEDERLRLDSLLYEVLGTRLDNPMAAGLTRLRPAALTAQLTLIAYARSHPGFGSRVLLDSYVQQQAEQAGKRISGFETLDFQLALVYTDVPLERQLLDLMCFVDHYGFHEAQLAKISEAYLAQRLDRVEIAADERLRNACDTSEEEKERLVYARNRDWAARMPAMMAGGSTLFAVGCLHLTGDKGLIALLRRAGYTVEPAS